MINILTGNISPSFGTAKINNSDIILDPGSIEQLIGLCPQHDILWEELTAQEHIELYARLRGNLTCFISFILFLKHLALLNFN